MIGRYEERRQPANVDAFVNAIFLRRVEVKDRFTSVIRHGDAEMPQQRIATSHPDRVFCHPANIQ